MSIKANPFMGFHINFDSESGMFTEPGWHKKEVLLLCLVEDIVNQNAADYEILCSEGLTSVIHKNEVVYSVEHSLISECGKDSMYSIVLLEVKDIDSLLETSKDFLKKSVGEFKKDDSLLGDWFDYDKRSGILMDRFFNDMIKLGLYNHLIPLISTPFTKDVFQYGKLSSDSPDILSKVKKETIRVKEKGA